MRFLQSTLILTLMAACQAPPLAPLPGAVPAAEAVLAVQRDAWNAGDIEGFLTEGYWQSTGLTFYSGGDVVQGYDAFAQRFRERYGSSPETMGTLDFRDIESARLGSRGALVRGRWELVWDDRETMGGLFTLLMRRGADGWRVVHDHTSVRAEE